MILGVLFACLICGCVSSKDIRVEILRPEEELPANLLVEYSEQMRYLAMLNELPERTARLKCLDAIDQKIEEAITLMEKYRKEFCFRECENVE